MNMVDLSFGFNQFHQKDQNILRSLLKKIDDVELPAILEIGAWTGTSTAVICSYLHNRKCHGGVTVIDTFKGTSDSILQNNHNKLI